MYGSARANGRNALGPLYSSRRTDFLANDDGEARQEGAVDQQQRVQEARLVGAGRQKPLNQDLIDVYRANQVDKGPDASGPASDAVLAA